MFPPFIFLKTTGDRGWGRPPPLDQSEIYFQTPALGCRKKKSGVSTLFKGNDRQGNFRKCLSFNTGKGHCKGKRQSKKNSSDPPCRLETAKVFFQGYSDELGDFWISRKNQKSAENRWHNFGKVFADVTYY